MPAGPGIGIPIPIPIPHPHVDIVGSILSALSRVLTGGVQSIATWAFDGMTRALMGASAA